MQLSVNISQESTVFGAEFGGCGDKIPLFGGAELWWFWCYVGAKKSVEILTPSVHKTAMPQLFSSGKDKHVNGVLSSIRG